MKKFTDLFIFELDRIKYGYLALIGLVAALQVAAVFQVRSHYMNMWMDFQRTTQGNVVDFLNQNGSIQFRNVTGYSHFYFFSLALGVFCLLLYSVVIWHRDWLGKNSFSYRLLTLPGSRMPVFFSKGAVILFMILGLLAIQLILLILEQKLLALLVPSEMFQANTLRQIIYSFEPFRLILPLAPIDFILHYTMGIGGLAFAFLLILIELSFKWKGWMIDAALVAVLVLIPVTLERFGFFRFLYPLETVFFWIFFGAVLFICSVVASRILLNKKIMA